MDHISTYRGSLDRASRHLDEMTAELAGVDDSLTPDDWLCVRARLGVLTSEFNAAVDEVDRIQGTTGARSRLLRYFQIRIGQTVTKEELSGVAGIHEWARRVRELRQDLGWDIHSAGTRAGLGIGEYVLAHDRPDPGLASAWAKARQMRNLRTIGGTPSAKTRTLEFLKAIYPRCADNEQLEHVARSAEAADRALQDLEADGWPVVDCTTGEPPAVTGHRLSSLDKRRVMTDV